GPLEMADRLISATRKTIQPAEIDVIPHGVFLQSQRLLVKLDRSRHVEPWAIAPMIIVIFVQVGEKVIRLVVLRVRLHSFEQKILSLPPIVSEQPFDSAITW